MRIGIFGSQEDGQCRALAQTLGGLGAESVLIEGNALDRGLPISVEDGVTTYRGQPVDDIRSFYLRQVPLPNVPTVEKEGAVVLHADWFTGYMQSRERSSFYLSWLLQLQRDGALVVNAPHAASVLQFKPFQLHVLRKLGAQVPRTLISNDPAAIRSFAAAVGDVIFKPLMGGALTEPLDAENLANLELVKASPVIFQERIRGDDLRVMLVGDEIVSCVAIQTPEQQLDFRGDAVYSSGKAEYREVELPPSVQDFCRRAARECGLHFAGIDIKHQGDDWVFLELNSSPIYLDVELKLGHPITQAIAKLLLAGP